MKTFFIALLGTLFAIALVVATVWWLIKRWLRKVFSPLAQALESFVPEPLRVTLKPAKHFELSNKAAFDQQCADLEALGFDRIGTFATEDIPGLTMAAFTLEGKHAYGVVYDLHGQPVWTDLVTSYEDGRACTYSNLKETGADQPPWTTAVKLPEKPVAEVFQAFLQGRPQGTMMPTPPADFVRVFEESYARQMDWRIARGVDEGEIRRVAKAANAEATEEELQLAIIARRAQRDGQIDEAVRKDYLRTSKVSAIEWEEIESRILVVHDTMVTDNVARQLLAAHGYVSDGEEGSDSSQKLAEIEERLKDGPVRGTFAALAAQTPPERECRRVWNTEKPVPADVWVMPPFPDEESADGDGDE
ncbi:MAG TPA: hypothetical protein VHN77_04965 [Phycisphaerales bacterium]|nr:hypothetical protein [Phycisphaerales bacterium]